MKKKLSCNVLLYHFAMKSLYQILIALWLSQLIMAAPISGQNILERKVNLSAPKTTLNKALKQIEKQAGVKFSYNSRLLPLHAEVSVDAANEVLSALLDGLLSPLGISYKQVSNHIVLRNTAILPREDYDAIEEFEHESSAEQPVLVERVIKGRVTDDQGQALPGVSIVIRGTQRGTITDRDGLYNLSIPDGNQTIAFSFVGYLTQQLIVAPKRTTVDIVLKIDEKSLEEMVVVGYGTQRKGDLTGSISSISSDVFDKSVATTLDQALQGRVAGLQVSPNSGVPGGGTSIQIRGVNSINSTNEPLYIIDGVIISGQTGNNDVNVLSNINTADVESIQVLKDASATAIYGAQGANGVIIITMKKGKEAKPSINFNSKFGFQKMSKQIDMMNLREYAQHHNDFSDVLGYGRRQDFSYPDVLGEGTNWQNELYKVAPIQTYDISVRGGSNGSTYSVSAGYMNQNGIVYGAGYQRKTLRISSDNTIRPWLKMGATVSAAYVTQQTAVSSWGVVGNALFQTPAIPVRNPDGSFGGPTSEFDANQLGFSNPVAIAQLNQQNRQDLSARGNLYLTAQLNKNFNLRTEFNGDGNIDNYQQFFPAYQFGESIKANTENAHEKKFRLYWGWRNLLNFEKSIGMKHRVSAMIAHEVISEKIDFLRGERQYGSNELTGLGAGDANYDLNNGWGSVMRRVSVFGRTTYNYDDRYLFTGTVRRDGSQNFAKGNQWGTFPSAAFAWRISEERFFEPAKRLVNDLKLRLSYGIVGNSNVSAFAYESNLLNTPTGNWGTALQTANISNRNLTWETTKSWNIGVDLSFFKKRVELVFDAYIKKTDDLLLRLSLPAFTGTSDLPGSAEAPWYNIGAIENKGFEFSLNTVNVRKTNFSWQSNLIFTLNRNKVTQMNTETADIPMYDNSNGKNIITRTMAGAPVSQFYGYKQTGRINSAADFLVDNGNGTSTVTTPTFKYNVGTILRNNDPTLITSTYIGDLLFSDANGDGIVNEKDIIKIGNPFPDYTFGFTNSFTQGNFDASVFINGTVNADVFNILRSRSDDPRSTSNVRKVVANYAKLGRLNDDPTTQDIWNVYVLPGADPNLGRMSVQNTNNSIFSDRFVENASFVRIQNVSFGYRVPKKLVSRLGIASLRFYANLQNLFVFSNYTGYDPEVGSYGGQSMLRYGVDNGKVPTPRIYTVGFDVNF